MGDPQTLSPIPAAPPPQTARGPEQPRARTPDPRLLFCGNVSQPSVAHQMGGDSVAADSVEREILIEASPEVVWRVITEPQQISRWFSDEAHLEGRAGTDG